MTAEGQIDDSVEFQVPRAYAPLFEILLQALGSRRESRTEQFGADSARMQGVKKSGILELLKRATSRQVDPSPAERQHGDSSHAVLDNQQANPLSSSSEDALWLVNDILNFAKQYDGTKRTLPHCLATHIVLQVSRGHYDIAYLLLDAIRRDPKAAGAIRVFYTGLGKDPDLWEQEFRELTKTGRLRSSLGADAERRITVAASPSQNDFIKVYLGHLDNHPELKTRKGRRLKKAVRGLLATALFLTLGELDAIASPSPTNIKAITAKIHLVKGGALAAGVGLSALLAAVLTITKEPHKSSTKAAVGSTLSNEQTGLQPLSTPLSNATHRNRSGADNKESGGSSAQQKASGLPDAFLEKHRRLIAANTALPTARNQDPHVTPGVAHPPGAETIQGDYEKVLALARSALLIKYPPTLLSGVERDVISFIEKEGGNRNTMILHRSDLSSEEIRQSIVDGQDLFGLYIELEALQLLNRVESVEVFETITLLVVKTNPSLLCNQLQTLLALAVAANMREKAETTIVRVFDECINDDAGFFFNKDYHIVQFFTETPKGRSILLRLCHGGRRFEAAAVKAGQLEDICRRAKAEY
jgi:hypothetical protein